VQSLRLAAAADVPALAALYRRCALALGPQVYSPQQVQAWASSADDAPRFARYILDAETWIAADRSGGPRGFCGVALHGDVAEVHSLYVDPAFGRQGLGSRLLAWAMAHARERGARHFAAWATPLSRPVFERAGLALERAVTEPYQGVLFERYRVATPRA
jgi:putative acetyltransferase